MSKERAPQPSGIDKKKADSNPETHLDPAPTKKTTEKSKPGANKSNRNPARGGSQFRYNGGGRR